MAIGFDTMHPTAAKALKEAFDKIGGSEEDIRQTWGTTVIASAGFHDPESTIDGHPFSSCVDLSWRLASRETKNRLVESGFVPFFRHTGSFYNNRHIHAVYQGLRDDNGNVTILPGPREQLIDGQRNLNGLVGHDSIESEYAFSSDELQLLKHNYSAWVPDLATAVISPDGGNIDCYAFIESDTVRCDLRPFYTFWDVKIAWDPTKGVTCFQDGKPVDMSHADLKLEGNEFTRGSVRGLAEAIGLKVNFEQHDHYAVVKLAY